MFDPHLKGYASHCTVLPRHQRKRRKKLESRTDSEASRNLNRRWRDSDVTCLKVEEQFTSDVVALSLLSNMTKVSQLMTSSDGFSKSIYY